MLAIARREPSAVLLAAQLAGVLLYPFMENSDAGRALFSLFGIAILGLVLLAVRSSPAWTGFGVLLAIPAAALLVIQAVSGSDALLPYSSAIEAVLYFYAAGALIAYMLADHEVTRDELFAVGATFTLVAWAFAYSYTVVQAIEPGSFTAAIDPTGDRSWTELLFLSFTTLSSTGLSDVIPVKPFARSLVMMEQLAGVAYIAMVVSRLVSLTVLRRANTGGLTADRPSCVGGDLNGEEHDEAHADALDGERQADVVAFALQSANSHLPARYRGFVGRALFVGHRVGAAHGVDDDAHEP